MDRRSRRWGPLMAILVPALFLSFLPGTRAAAYAVGDEVSLDRWLQTAAAEFARGVLDGTIVVAAGGGEVRLAEGRALGSFVSPQHEVPFPCLAAGLLYRARVPSQASLVLELRARDEDGVWSEWIGIPSGPWVDPEGRTAGETLAALDNARTVQYRATLATAGVSPALEEVLVVCLGTEATPATAAVPPWNEPDWRAKPVLPSQWGAAPVTPTAAITPTGPVRIEVRPALLALGSAIESSRWLRMMQHFQREVLGFDDLAYAFLVDAAGGVYQGRAHGLWAGPEGEVLYIGVLGAHPREPVSPTVEDALVALLDGWGVPQPGEPLAVSLAVPADPLVAERLWSRWQAGNLRRGEWVLPRGATGPRTDEWILLTNPEPVRAQVTTELHRIGGRVVRRTIPVAGESRYSLYADTLVPDDVFWTLVRARTAVLVERALYYGHDADDSTGLDGLSQAWYLPGGMQQAGMTTTLTLLNPGKDAVTATVTVYSPSGPAGEGAILLAPQARLDIPLRQFYTGTAQVGCQVAAPAPIAAEQEVRFSGGAGGYAMPGTPILSRQWTFAGVETGRSSVTVLSLLNPYSEAVTITLTLMSEDGTTLRRSYSVLPGQQELNLNSVLPELALAAEIRSGRPIAAARITYFNGLQSAHATLGAARLSRHWYLPEGCTAEPFETFLILANPNAVSNDIVVTFLGQSGELERAQVSLPAYARLTLAVNEVLPDVAAFSTHVQADWPVVVERTMYLHQMQGGHSSLGIAR